MKRILFALFVVLGLGLRASGGERWTLERALVQAQSANPDARIAQQRMTAAQAGLEQARATWWPQLQLQSGYLYTDNPVTVFGAVLNQQSYSPSLDFNNVPDTDNLNVRGVVTMPLYAGGQLSARRAAARATAEASERDQASVVQLLDFEVARAWFSVRKAGAFLAAAEASVRAFETNLALARVRFAEGTQLKTDVLDLEVRLAQSQEDLLRARNGSELAQRALGSLLGLENEAAQVSDSPGVLATPPAELDFSGRPELAANQLRTQAAGAELRRARSGYLPSLNAFGAVDYDYGWRNDSGAPSYTAGLMLKWNLWDGRETKGKIGEAGAHLELAQEWERKVRLEIDLQVSQARLALREAGERIAVTEKTVALAEESVLLTRARFEEGKALASQLIDAETALTGARVRRISAQTDQQIAIAALRRALGLPQLAANEAPHHLAKP